MTMVNIDNELYDKVRNHVRNHNIEYPNIKNFIDKCIHERLIADKWRGRK